MVQKRAFCIVSGEVTTDDVETSRAASKKGELRARRTRVRQRMCNEFTLEMVREKCKEHVGNFKYFDTCSMWYCTRILVRIS